MVRPLLGGGPHRKKAMTMARRAQMYFEGGPIPAAAQRHLETLGFNSTNAYLNWCVQNDFGPWLDKSGHAMAEERDCRAAERHAAARQTRLHKTPKAFLEAVCTGEIDPAKITRPAFHMVAHEITTAKRARADRRSFLDMALTLLRHKDLVFGLTVDETPLIRGLIKLHDRKALWLRPLEQWKPKSKNPERQLAELTRHLFDQYGDVPAFMDQVWLRTDQQGSRYRDWYAHLGRGNNVRTAKSKVKLTKRMAHEFMKAPEDYTVEQAIRWGQMRAMGADKSMVNAVAATRLGRSFVHEAFWITVLRFFADNPMLDTRQIGPIVDYLHAQRFQSQDVELRPGVWRREPPQQPGLSMRGRTVDTLLRQVHDWHTALGKARQVPDGAYAEAKIPDFHMQRGTSRNRQHWSIRQLRSAKELVRESEALRHCVSSYHWSCASGHCTIWSLSVDSAGTSERRQTIEVARNGQIVQCRGLANRDPSPEERSVVEAWAAETGLKLATYL